MNTLYSHTSLAALLHRDNIGDLPRSALSYSSETTLPNGAAASGVVLAQMTGKG